MAPRIASGPRCRGRAARRTSRGSARAGSAPASGRGRRRRRCRGSRCRAHRPRPAAGRSRRTRHTSRRRTTRPVGAGRSRTRPGQAGPCRRRCRSGSPAPRRHPVSTAIVMATGTVSSRMTAAARPRVDRIRDHPSYAVAPRRGSLDGRWRARLPGVMRAVPPTASGQTLSAAQVGEDGQHAPVVVRARAAARASRRCSRCAPRPSWARGTAGRRSPGSSGPRPSARGPRAPARSGRRGARGRGAGRPAGRRPPDRSPTRPWRSAGSRPRTRRGRRPGP